MFCTKCGSSVSAGSAFCTKCGAPVKGENPQVPGATNVIPEGHADSVAAVSAAVSTRKRSKAPIIVTAVAVVAIAAVGIGAYFAFLSPVKIDEAAFPDEALRTAIATADTDGDGALSRDEMKGLETLSLAGSGVASLDGLERFENLHELDLSDTASLQHADFSKASHIEKLDLTNSALAEADVSALVNLQSLSAQGSGLTAIDVSKNVALSNLSIGDDVAITGLEGTNLREQYIMTKVTALGFPGATDMNGAGWVADEAEYEFSYDEHNALKSYTERYHVTSNNTTSTMGASYTLENGRIVRAEGTGNRSSISSEVDYDEKGRPSTVREYRQSNGSRNVTVHTMEYDDADRLVSRTVDYGSSSTTFDYLYNDLGQLVRMENRASSGVYVNEFSYDDTGRIVNAKSDYEEFEFDYNDAGQLTEKRMWWCSNGVRSGDATRITFIYDQDGRLASGTRVTGATAVSNVEWFGGVSYDARGLVTQVFHSIEAENGGETTIQDGEVDFEYKRVFTAKDAPDVDAPVKFGDPTVWVYAVLPVHFDVFGGSNQSPIAYTTCDQVFGNTSITL